MSVYPIYRHKKGNLYAHTVTDDISAGEYVACYKTELNSCTPKNPMKYWARPLEMFFDGRFKRVRQ